LESDCLRRSRRLHAKGNRHWLPNYNQHDLHDQDGPVHPASDNPAGSDHDNRWAPTGHWANDNRASNDSATNDHTTGDNDNTAGRDVIMTSVSDRAETNTGDASGFTLIEMMIALAIFVAVITLAFGQLSTGVQQTATIDRASNSNSAARLVMESLKTELRQTSTGDTDLETIFVMTGTEIAFYTPDRKTPMHLMKVAYRLNGHVLERSSVSSTNADGAPWIFPVVSPTWVPLLAGVLNTDLFAYTASSGSPATDSATVRTVGLHLVLASGLSTPATVVYQVEVNVRSHQ
jgi:prepilin-type N-terminal cleavage/methylation domain-containing protein